MAGTANPPFERRAMLKISEGTGKLEHINSINTNPLTNPFCNRMSGIKGTVCSKCYSRRACSSYRKCATSAWDDNAAQLIEHIKDEDLPVINAAFFRFHSHGELINDQHFKNLCRIARKNIHCIFTLWTKRKRIVQRHRIAVPRNMVLIYSAPKIDTVNPVIPKGFHKVFNVVSKSNNFPRNCFGRCIDCLLCYSRDGETVITEKIK